MLDVSNKLSPDSKTPVGKDKRRHEPINGSAAGNVIQTTTKSGLKILTKMLKTILKCKWSDKCLCHTLRMAIYFRYEILTQKTSTEDKNCNQEWSLPFDEIRD